ncbi:hypothetical protein VOLCADRAFT_93325 [Volvox carteri f. nagariensis]|uniref:Uncharacterized protein n=1 Tax=Volvox carteri f. nagariensis TaxID=3068 RepID=D8U1U6_VOLCA|nr:uncharacterized protein VOLCADRAFT_93325 [Volvox carteri f. nagariensis]EFJ46243.1 hypothetical protein VOLCADRAFT_93325 [Volvox carteri f. nagariensis]|eukprot:XP_002952690.1 hypothetical protein VOLCADRAFT_93325 [Volvox carteri f. nagariensis]
MYQLPRTLQAHRLPPSAAGRPSANANAKSSILRRQRLVLAPASSGAAAATALATSRTVQAAHARSERHIARGEFSAAAGTGRDAGSGSGGGCDDGATARAAGGGEDGGGGAARLSRPSMRVNGAGKGGRKNAGCVEGLRAGAAGRCGGATAGTGGQRHARRSPRFVGAPASTSAAVAAAAAVLRTVANVDAPVDAAATDAATVMATAAAATVKLGEATAPGGVHAAVHQLINRVAAVTTASTAIFDVAASAQAVISADRTAEPRPSVRSSTRRRKRRRVPTEEDETVDHDGGGQKVTEMAAAATAAATAAADAGAAPAAFTAGASLGGDSTTRVDAGVHVRGVALLPRTVEDGGCVAKRLRLGEAAGPPPRTEPSPSQPPLPAPLPIPRPLQAAAAMASTARNLRKAPKPAPAPPSPLAPLVPRRPPIQGAAIAAAAAAATVVGTADVGCGCDGYCREGVWALRDESNLWRVEERRKVKADLAVAGPGGNPDSGQNGAAAAAVAAAAAASEAPAAAIQQQQEQELAQELETEPSRPYIVPSLRGWLWLYADLLQLLPQPLPCFLPEPTSAAGCALAEAAEAAMAAAAAAAALKTSWDGLRGPGPLATPPLPPPPSPQPNTTTPCLVCTSKVKPIGCVRQDGRYVCRTCASRMIQMPIDLKTGSGTGGTAAAANLISGGAGGSIGDGALSASSWGGVVHAVQLEVEWSRDHVEAALGLAEAMLKVASLERQDNGCAAAAGDDGGGSSGGARPRQPEKSKRAGQRKE